jgi:hypothetical protein
LPGAALIEGYRNEDPRRAEPGGRHLGASPDELAVAQGGSVMQAHPFGAHDRLRLSQQRISRRVDGHRSHPLSIEGGDATGPVGG